MATENWVWVRGYEGIYEVSDIGNVRRKGKVLKKRPRNKYLSVRLYLDGKPKDFNIHRLVAIGFLKQDEHRTFVDHIDFNKENNRADNLRWCTQRENVSSYYSSIETSSKYLGVSRRRGAKKWDCNIRVDGRPKHLGRFDNEYDAHLKYIEQVEIINKTKEV